MKERIKNSKSPDFLELVKYRNVQTVINPGRINIRKFCSLNTVKSINYLVLLSAYQAPILPIIKTMMPISTKLRPSEKPAFIEPQEPPLAPKIRKPTKIIPQAINFTLFHLLLVSSGSILRGLLAGFIG